MIIRIIVIINEWRFFILTSLRILNKNSKILTLSAIRRSNDNISNNNNTDFIIIPFRKCHFCIILFLSLLPWSILSWYCYYLSMALHYYHRHHHVTFIITLPPEETPDEHVSETSVFLQTWMLRLKIYYGDEQSRTESH